MTHSGRYKLARRMAEFCNSLSDKYGHFGSTKIRLSNDKHLADRYYDRDVKTKEFQSLLSWFMRYHLVKLLCTIKDQTKPRISVRLNDGNNRSLTISGTVVRTEHYGRVTYTFKLRTMFYSDFNHVPNHAHVIHIHNPLSTL